MEPQRQGWRVPFAHQSPNGTHSPSHFTPVLFPHFCSFSIGICSPLLKKDNSMGFSMKFVFLFTALRICMLTINVSDWER
jgi:hypothetical protein